MRMNVIKFLSLVLAVVVVVSPTAWHEATQAQTTTSTFTEVDCAEVVELVPDVQPICGTISVPERRGSDGNAAPDTREITLFVLLLDNDPDKKNPPVLYLAGGPGGSGTMSYDEWLENPVFEDRTLILLDQRGTGASEPSLNCVENDDPSNDSPTATTLCRARLAKAGIDLAAYNSAESTADVQDVRRALGIEQLDLMGISYGTRLALTVLRDQPQGIRSVILDGVYPPHINHYEDIGPYTVMQFDKLFTACAEEAACAAAFPDLRAKFYQLLTTLDDKPAVYESEDPETGEKFEVEMTDDDLVDILFQAMYDTLAIPELPRVVYAATQGDFAPLAEFQASSGARRAARSKQEIELYYDDDAEGVFISVECREELPFNSLARATTLMKDIDEPLRAKLTSDVETSFADCEIWAIPAGDARENEPVRSDVPALILSGEFDPITPPVNATEAAKYLTNHHEFVIPGGGHSVIGANDCVNQITRVFLADPTKALDGACVQTLKRAPFVLKTP
jgi:pimeloyl-ACP methyl ester carboxylesterase